MKAAAVIPKKKDSIRVIELDKPTPGDHEVLVKVKYAGIDGTDQEINDGMYGMAPAGCEYLIIGHEAIGIVESRGSAVRSMSPGDIVVSTARRPCRERCFACSNRQEDMCLTGDYLERGIKGLHGFMSEYYIEDPEYMI